VAPISQTEVVAEPERLSVAGVSTFEARLLGSARGDAMPFRSRRRMLAGLGVGGLLSTSTVVSAVKAAGVKAALSVVAGTGVAGALALALTGAPAAPPAPASAPLEKAVQGARPVPPPAAVTHAVPTSVVEEPAPARPARSTPRSSDALAAELRALEEARAAFVTGDHALALGLLDAYDARFPRRSLGTEATVLRIETLVKRGDHAQAARLGRDFLARHAAGPYARRVRSLVAQP
jgi:hypothetical protein